jgi:hypothetical protein
MYSDNTVSDCTQELCVKMHCKQFSDYVFPKKIKPSLTSNSAVSIKTTYFQTDYEITLLQEIHISRLELQRWPLEFVISFAKVYIWD